MVRLARLGVVAPLAAVQEPAELVARARVEVLPARLALSQQARLSAVVAAAAWVVAGPAPQLAAVARAEQLAAAAVRPLAVGEPARPLAVVAPVEQLAAAAARPSAVVAVAAAAGLAHPPHPYSAG